MFKIKNRTSMKRIISGVLLTVWVTTCIWAQTADIKKSMYQAYLFSSKKTWKENVVKLEKKYSATSSKEDLYLLASSYYGILNATMADKDEDTFDEYIDIAKDKTNELMELDEKHSSARALKAAIYSLEMAYSPWKGMYLGSRSDKLISKAVKYDSTNPFAWKMRGSSLLYTPAMFGGDPEEAIEVLKKSVKLFEADTENLQYNWLYLDALALLGQAYLKTDNQNMAIATYEKALEIEPDFGWVKYSLLPYAKNEAGK